MKTEFDQIAALDLASVIGGADDGDAGPPVVNPAGGNLKPFGSGAYQAGPSRLGGTEIDFGSHNQNRLVPGRTGTLFNDSPDSVGGPPGGSQRAIT